MKVFAFLKSGKKLDDMQAWDTEYSFRAFMAEKWEASGEDPEVILINETRFNRVTNLATELEDDDYAVAIDLGGKKKNRHRIYVEASPHFTEFLMRHTDKTSYEAILLYNKEQP